MNTTTLPAPAVVDYAPVLISRPLPAVTARGTAPGHAVIVDHGISAAAPFETWLVRSGDGGRSWRGTLHGAWRTLVEAQAALLALA